ncbi:hypothetical protein RB195_009694 [Necator americanus]|uniref:Ubiquitinyl hydrolase 1 n=1 Tax=Necator americanus TaxID=51031 RepID=A0ABR1CV87_NECAM
MDLYVRCTLEYLDISSSKNFSGKLFVDPGERSFTVVEFKQDGRKEEHKFFADEFVSFACPPSKSTAQQFALTFSLPKQPSGRFQKRKRTLIVKTPDYSQKIKDIYEELKKAFRNMSENPSRFVNSSSTSPVGMLRSRPDPVKTVKSSRLEHKHRIPKFIFDDTPPIRCSEPFSSNVCKKSPSVTSTKSPLSSGCKDYIGPTTAASDIPVDFSSSRDQVSVSKTQENEREGPSNDIIIINDSEAHLSNKCSNESVRSTTSKYPKPASVVQSENNSTDASLNPEWSENPARKLNFSKEPQCRKIKKSNGPDRSSQGSIISVVEKEALESSTIRVTAPFKARPHTVTFKQKREDYTHSKPSLAKRLASDFRKEPIPNDTAIDLSGLNSPSLYGSSTPNSSSKQQQKRPGEIISPRPQLLADSISSSRCLLTPPSGSKGLYNTSFLSNRESVTPSRKRKEIEDFSPKDFDDMDSAGNLFPTTSDQQPSPYSYRGLENLTNSCYMNATLQALASVFPFYYRMQMIQHRRDEGGYECSEFVRRFNDVLHNLVSPDRDVDTKYGAATKVAVLEALRTAAGKELGSDPDFGSNMQQDAHEFLAKTLEILEKEAMRKKRNLIFTNEKTKNPSVEQPVSSTSSSRNPAGVFQHKIRDRFGCERCARASEMTNDAIDLTVTVSAGESIQKMIENALAREEIEYKCDHCGTGAGFISRAFATLPQSLIVVVKRYRFGEAGGSKVEERIGVSRELFLKDLFVDSEVKKQEGVARRSLSRSVESFIGDPKENGRSDDSGVNSEVESVITIDDQTQFSGKEEDFGSANVSVIGNEELKECVFELSQGSANMKTCESPRSTAESHITIDKHDTHTALEKSDTASLEVGNQSHPLSRLALSPLKMNRADTIQDEKPGDPYGFPRKMRVVEGMDMDTSVSSSISECMLEYHEKENAIFNPIKVVPEIEGPIIKQSGGYLKETTPDTESARSGDGSTASREAADVPNDIGSASTQSEDNVLEKDVNSLKLSDSANVPNKRARLDDSQIVNEEKTKVKDTSSSVVPTEPSTSYARQITEPLRPSSRTPGKYAHTPTTPLLEQISVVGEFEEKVVLVFRPVFEERQKQWCQRFGFRYFGSPELRKKMFGREVEFTLRDMPQSCEVRGDGNCLFRTLSWWITGGNEREYFRLREKLVSFMTKYRSKFANLLLNKEDMNTHLERMSEDGEWGTQVELVAAACWLKVNIYTFLEGKWLRYRPLFRWSFDGNPAIAMSRDECTDDMGAIFICNASGCHFQPAVSVEPHITRRCLRPRKEREFVKEASPIRGTPEPPYVFNSADGPVYSLSAVICHHGDSLLTGHYSTFALDATRREWLDCNDHIITKVSEVEVIDNSASSGYIFIYNRVEDSMNRL